MADAQLFEAALVAPVAGTPQPRASQVAIIALCGETPSVAGGATLHQAAFIAVVKDFYIPPIYIPIPCGRFMQTMPYYVGEYQ